MCIRDRNYTTYKTYYRLIKSIEDDPKVDKRKAARALARFMSMHPHNIAQKTEVMIEHFRHFTMHKIGGRAKAMVVTSSRLPADRSKQTLIGEQADPKQLYELHAKLDAQQVYHKAEVEEFCRVFYKPKRNQTAADHARMNACIDPAVGRFNELEEEEREEFRKTLTAFRNLYSFLSQVIPFQDTDLEKLYSYIRFLLTKLPRADYGAVYHFSDDVSLKYYRLQKIGEGSIDLEPGKTEPVDGPTAVGTKAAHPDDIELSRLIDILNERFGTEFKPGDELFFESIREDAVADSNPVSYT